MNRSFSVYLDLVRFSAAVFVYLWHSNLRLLVTDVLPLSNYGHSAVIVFFVLSGFVIAFVTDTKERTWVAYGASRLSRVFSVVIPTLVLTPLLDAWGRALYPDLYSWPFDRFALRVLGSALMLNETWFVSITYFSNAPYWSIAYEFWYYIIFGLLMFLPSGTRRWAVLLVLSLLGPKIVLLFPIWLAGVALYRWQWPSRLSQSASWVLVAVSMLGIYGVHHAGVYDATNALTRAALGPDLYRELVYSKFFLGDYVLTAFVFCNFAAMRNVAPSLEGVFARIEPVVRWLAGFTFTLYLLHQPLCVFWTAVVRGDPTGYGFWWTVTGLTAVSVLVIGTLTEQRRSGLRRLIERKLAAVNGLRAG